ncbi:HlyD family secretion protein [Roseisolibacter agri]|uniref:Secretion protein HlyD n=1 Tax=Roseisolibacter agri TaxID=2014610 RepID=A0AA37V219_9BACT|nr:HlyD family secretion protein [Roseisolibacter agri]GLC27130.1 secretion protein HlyD [Roseisolibacter agri]
MSAATAQSPRREEPTPIAPLPPAAAPAAPAAPAKGSRRNVVLPVVAVLVLAGAAWGGKQWMYAQAHESTDNAQVDGHIVPVIAKVGGYVSAVNVVENQTVAGGAPLVQIDDAEYRVRLSQAEADLAAAQATAGTGGQVGQAEAQVQTASSQTAAGRAQVEAARATLARAESDFRRYQELAAQQIVSQQSLDAARAAVAVARAQLAATQRQTTATGAGVENAQAGVRLARARLAGAQAQRENAALQLSYTKVTAPASGHVSKKTVEVGQLVQPGQTLMSIVADTGVWVTANYKETQLRGLRVGQPVEIDVDAYEGAKVEGVVESIGSATGARFALLPPDNATGNFTKVVQRVPVRIKVTRGLGAERPLRPGMSVIAHARTR